MKKLNFPWFKYRCNLSQESKGITKLLDQYGKEMFANYILLLELLSQNFNGTSNIKLSKTIIANYLRIRNTDKLLTKTLTIISKSFENKLKFTSNEFEINFDFPKLMNLFGKKIFKNKENKESKDIRINPINSEEENKELINSKERKFKTKSFKEIAEILKNKYPDVKISNGEFININEDVIKTLKDSFISLGVKKENVEGFFLKAEIENIARNCVNKTKQLDISDKGFMFIFNCLKKRLFSI